jgi:hypothetical protein
VLIVDTDPSVLRAMSPQSDVMIEPEIIHDPTRRYRPADFNAYPASELLAPLLTAAEAARRVEVTVLGSGARLDGAEVLLFLRGPGGTPR